MCRIGALVAAAAVLTVIAPGAAAGVTRHCGSVRLNQVLERSAHGLFGARGITAVDLRCAAARRLALTYVSNPYSAAPSHRSSTVRGFRCRWTVDRRVAQQVRVTCTRRSAKVTFADRVPNG